MPEPAPRYICIHGHFYQPPRENPWLETIERQESAYPFHDWNQRILAECYRPNAAARIVDEHNRIIRIANNYQNISFNFGPTLLSWMQRHAPSVYRAILRADSDSVTRFSGHGSALAQAYNHIIMPLADARDRATQVSWGIADFRQRFGREPEGMWLPETAVCGHTLDALAEHGIEFTILAPGQARRVRRMAEGERPPGPWRDVSDGRIEPGRVYRARTPAGRHIDIFFYHGPNSNAIAFERLLDNGGRFADRLAKILPSATMAEVEPMLSHVATDGETYGHHHRYGDMALAYALHRIEQSETLELTNYGHYRARHPARYEVEIAEQTAWSCAHGLGRWSRDCGCNMGSFPGGNQEWRAHVRQALDQLRDRLAELFVSGGQTLLIDPWAARDHYIEVINDRSQNNVERFLAAHAVRPLSRDEQVRALQLLEMQRHAMLMYTSCGWFFDDFTGPEGTQILRYAARAIELGQRISADDLEGPFVDALERARSNRPEMGNGRSAYDKLVRPAQIDLRRAIAHFAISSLFADESAGFSGNGPEEHSEERPEQQQIIYCYRMRPVERARYRSGRARLVVGTVECTSTITWATSTLSYAALHFGDHNLTGGTRQFSGQEGYRAMVTDLTETFLRADLIATQRCLDGHFADSDHLTFSLESLFPDEREQILARLLMAPVADAEAAYDQLYMRHAPLMRYLEHLDVPIPEAFLTTARFTLKSRLRRVLVGEYPTAEALRAILGQAESVGADLDDLSDRGLDYLWQTTLERLSERVLSEPADQRILTSLCEVAEVSREHGFAVELWHTQNACYQLVHAVAPARRQAATDGTDDGLRDYSDWARLVERLCTAVGLAVPHGLVIAE